MSVHYSPALAEVRKLYGSLSDADVAAILSDLIEGAMGTNIGDDLWDALTPLQEALNEAWPAMDRAANPEPETVPITNSMSIWRAAMVESGNLVPGRVGL